MAKEGEGKKGTEERQGQETKDEKEPQSPKSKTQAPAQPFWKRLPWTSIAFGAAGFILGSIVGGPAAGALLGPLFATAAVGLVRTYKALKQGQPWKVAAGSALVGSGLSLIPGVGLFLGLATVFAGPKIASLVAGKFGIGTAPTQTKGVEEPKQRQGGQSPNFSPENTPVKAHHEQNKGPGPAP